MTWIDALDAEGAKALTTRLTGLAVRTGVAAQDAPDLVQDAFGKFQRYAVNNSVENPEGMLRRIVVNLAIDYTRARRRNRISPIPVEDYDIVDKNPLPDAVLMGRQRLKLIEAAFAALDPLTAAIIRDHRIEGIKLAEVAKRHGVSLSTVEKRLAKGLKQLIDRAHKAASEG